MGWIRHHAIVVTTFRRDGGCIRNKALGFFDEMHVSPVMESLTNGYESVFIAPDGSKEGWPASNDGDDARTGFMEWLKTECPVWVDAVEVEYGEVEVFRVSDAVGELDNPQRKGGE